METAIIFGVLAVLTIASGLMADKHYDETIWVILFQIFGYLLAGALVAYGVSGLTA